MYTILIESVFETDTASLREEEEEKEKKTEEKVRKGEREEEHQQRYPRGISSENSGEDVKLDYQSIQMNLIFSDTERKQLWDEYKCYVDKKVFIGLQNATLCR